VLHRHWSLMEALHHTPELLACIQTFKEGGMGRTVLTYVLAQLGIPLPQARARGDWSLCRDHACLPSCVLAQLGIPLPQACAHDSARCGCFDRCGSLHA
jgi:hypothetical protein